MDKLDDVTISPVRTDRDFDLRPRRTAAEAMWPVVSRSRAATTTGVPK
jgi:hypothetical protein